MKKYSYNYIKEALEKEDYTLLSGEYISGKKLKYKCPNGHVRKILFGHFKKGQRCKLCLANTLKLDFNYVNKSIEDGGYTLVSKEYINARSHLECICSFGHKHNTSWYNWKSGYRCKTCAEINYSLKYSGENSPSWKGGKSFEGYCLDWKLLEFKNLIKERDKYLCQNPYCFGTSSRLVVHHTDYDKSNCELNNLITLCDSCNSRANKDRSWHKNWYRILMVNKYGYKYDKIGDN